MRTLKVVIDPGHGGRDTGAVAREGSVCVYEKDINLAVALLLRLKFQVAGLAVKLTRDKDKTISLWRRCWVANRWDADLFLSVHINSYGLPTPRGFQVNYYRGSLKGRLVAKGIVVNYLNLVVENRDLVVHGLGLFASDFYVLRKTRMPAVMVELGFISNETDLQLLTSPDRLGLITNAVADYVVSDAFRGMVET